MKIRSLIFALGIAFLIAARGDTSSALEASHVVSTASAYLIDVTITNTNASAQWILFIDSATLPSDGTVTYFAPPLRVSGTSTTEKTFPIHPQAKNGIVICNSSTAFSGTTPTKTIGSADCFFEWHVR